MRKLLLFFLLFAAGPCLAAFGYHGGRNCYASAGDAFAEKCAGFVVVSATNNEYSSCRLATVGAPVQCVSTGAYNFCDVQVTVMKHSFNGNDTAATSNNATQYWSLPSCDLGPSSADKIADMSLLWGLFLGAAIVIYTLRRLLGIWERSPHEES